ncbi:MAG: IS110 family transposase [Ktedonobacteraceae bacterium]
MKDHIHPPVGIDVSKKTLDVQLGTTPKNKRLRHRFANEEAAFADLLRWMQEQGYGEAHVCLEATGTYSDAITLFLHEHGLCVSVLNPARVAAFRKSEGIINKTDAIDAYVLALFCQQKQPLAWQPKPEHTQQMQVLLARLEQLKQNGVQESNRLENHRLDAQTRQEIGEHLAYLHRCIQQTQERVVALVKEHERLQHDCEHLVSVKGIGLGSAIFFLGEIGDVSTFASARNLAAFWGVVSKKTSSGTSVQKKERLSKQGSPLARKRLYLCALSAMRSDPDVQRWAAELRAKGKPGQVIVVAVMRKLVHIIYGILKSGQAYDRAKAWPQYATTPVPLDIQQEVQAA